MLTLYLDVYKKVTGFGYNDQVAIMKKILDIAGVRYDDFVSFSISKETDSITLRGTKIFGMIYSPENLVTIGKELVVYNSSQPVWQSQITTMLRLYTLECLGV